MIYVNGVAKPKLSDLVIDADKDWVAKKIENLGAPDTDDDVPRRDTIDSKITTHKGDAAAHHAKTVNASELSAGLLALARLPATLTGKDADTVDGAHKTDLETTMDGKITTHKGDAAAHHAKTVNASELNAGLLALARLPATLTGKDADTVDGAHKTDLETTMDGKITTHKGDASAHHADPTNWSKVSAYRTTDQSLAGAGMSADVDFNTEEFDTRNEFASHKFTATEAGYYLVIGQVMLDSLGDGNYLLIEIARNATVMGFDYAYGSAAGQMVTARITRLLHMNVGEYVYLMAAQDTGSDQDIKNGKANSFINIMQLSKD